MKNTKSFSGQKGMSLVELLVAVAMLGVVVGTASSYFADMNKQSNVEFLKELQMKIARDIEIAVSNPDSIKNSVNLPANSALTNCVSPGRTCTQTEPPGAFFTLMNTEAVPTALSGPTIGFDLEGGRCTVGDIGCVFNPVVKFWATCELDSGNRPQRTCTKPGMLNFKYQINVTHPKYAQRISTYPPPNAAGVANIDNDELRGVIRMRVTDVLVRIGDSCAPGQMLLGFDQQGKAQCECLVQKTTLVRGNPTPQYDSFGRKICGDQACPANQLMTGYQEVTTRIRGVNYKAVVPRCRGEAACSVASPPADCPCKIVNLDSTGDCGPGFWMVSITHGVCEATTEKNGKGAPETVKCSTRTGRCCSFEQQ